MLDECTYASKILRRWSGYGDDGEKGAPVATPSCCLLLLWALDTLSAFLSIKSRCKFYQSRVYIDTYQFFHASIILWTTAETKRITGAIIFLEELTFETIGWRLIVALTYLCQIFRYVCVCPQDASTAVYAENEFTATRWPLDSFRSSPSSTIHRAVVARMHRYTSSTQQPRRAEHDSRRIAAPTTESSRKKSTDVD